jgi:signal transduction histidine kinase
MAPWNKTLSAVFPGSIRLQFIMPLFVMLISLMGSMFYFYSRYDEEWTEIYSRHLDVLSQLVALGVENLSKSDGDRKVILEEWARLVRETDLELSIIDRKQNVIMSSDPEKVGAKVSIDQNRFLITTTVGQDDPENEKKVYSIFIPVDEGGERIGYVNLLVSMEEIDRWRRGVFLGRMVMTGGIFVLGCILSIVLSTRMVGPFVRMKKAFQLLGEGKFQKIREEPRGEVGELIVSFNQMIDQMEKRKEIEQRAKKMEEYENIAVFAQGVAHEFRNPLNYINLALDQIRSRHEGLEETDTTARYMEKVKAEIRKLNSLIENFVQLGKPISLHRTWFRVGDLFEELLEYFSDRIESAPVAVRGSYGTVRLHADREKLEMAFSNVIVNALDAMPSGGTLEIRVLEGMGACEIVIQDTGSGLSEEIRGVVGRPFYTTKAKGMGMGLAFTRKLIESHGGEFEIGPREGRGTVVTLRIPQESGK